MNCLLPKKIYSLAEDFLVEHFKHQVGKCSFDEWTGRWVLLTAFQQKTWRLRAVRVGFKVKPCAKGPLPGVKGSSECPLTSTWATSGKESACGAIWNLGTSKYKPEKKHPLKKLIYICIYKWSWKPTLCIKPLQGQIDLPLWWWCLVFLWWRHSLNFPSMTWLPVTDMYLWWLPLIYKFAIVWVLEDAKSDPGLICHFFWQGLQVYLQLTCTKSRHTFWVRWLLLDMYST